MATKKKTLTRKAAKPAVKKNVALKSSRSDFWKVDFTVNTVYWLIIGLAVIATAVWTYNTNEQITAIYDSIDQTSISDDDVTSPTARPAGPTY